LKLLSLTAIKEKEVMNILDYLNQVKQKFDSKNATEHTYRPALENYLNFLYQGKIQIANEPKRQKCGAPDFILSKKRGKSEIPVGYIEAKDIGKNLDELSKTDQLKRYKESLDNLIFTDYLDFVFYKEGKQYERVQIAKIAEGEIIFLDDNFQKLEQLLDNFILFSGQTIKSSKDLAMIMAKKAKLMRESFFKALISEEDSGIKQQLQAFKNVLIHDITEDRFANIYAQTIAYGLFTARLHDKTLDTFSREESYDLIPKSNPFLRQLFRYVAMDIEDEIKWTVDELCEVFRHANINEILGNFGKSSGRNDPIIHFYEDFLKEFDPEVRKARGVWYTPEPVVNFIIRAVDEVLKTHFNLKDGIADSSKIKIKRDSSLVDKRTKTGKAQDEIEVHKIQLLDIATGTGTFTAEVIKQIYQNYYQGQEGMWSNYVDEDLLPRLHGFEILMASYAMCHLKIDLLLKETGYKPKNEKTPPRLGVYLTNALEESDKDYDNLFASFLSNEAKEASRIKRETPVMVAFGNPPYSVSSQNKGEWIHELIKDYKKNLNEKKINLDDDYIKFIRMSEHYINKTGHGVIAMITNNSFLDGITHRQMRKHLLETFDTIYVYDLHGNSKKQETAPDGSRDENVFDIMQGVSISIFVKDGKRKQELADVLHFDSYGNRKEKYEKLWEGKLGNVGFEKLEYKEPYYFFVPKDFRLEENYEKSFRVDEFFVQGASGIETMKDSLVIEFEESGLKKRIDAAENDDDEFLQTISKKVREDQILRYKDAIVNKQYEIKEVLYRPLDIRKFLYWSDNSGVMWRNRGYMMSNMDKPNIGIGFSRTVYGSYDWQDVFVSNFMAEKGFMAMRISNAAKLFPLYLYNQENTLDNKTRTPNLNPEIIKEISDKLGLKFIEDHELPNAKNKDNFSPLDLLDYIYAILHSPTYREKYKEFLKIDFPRVPYPSNQEKFWQLVDLGKQIRNLHLMEGKKFDGISSLITKYPISGNNKVATINAKSFIIKPENPNLGKVFINKDQYFDNVPVIAWNFYIGGYQPAQKWLKDRKERELSRDDILHYQKIIVALFETDRLMKEIDQITF